MYLGALNKDLYTRRVDITISKGVASKAGIIIISIWHKEMQNQSGTMLSM